MSTQARKAFEIVARRFGSEDEDLKQNADGCYIDKNSQSYWVVFEIAWNEVSTDLVEALELLLGKAYKQNFNDSYPEILAKAEAAIAKARGAE